MEYEWDAHKARVNLRKHQIDFADAVSVFDDPLALTIPDPGLEEDRFITLGIDALGRVLVVVYTWRGDYIRVISARRASRHEHRHYEGEP
jgi:hypothetical protein